MNFSVAECSEIAVLLTFFSSTLGVDVSRRFISLLCLWLRSSKELESDIVFLLLLLLLLLLTLGFGWLVSKVERCTNITIFHPSWAVSRKGVQVSIRYVGEGFVLYCMYRKQVYCTRLFIDFPHLYFLLMFCAQRFYQGESMGGLFVG